MRRGGIILKENGDETPVKGSVQGTLEE